ncbi:unnamed protein product [Chrysoparadoxa australica]
MVFPKKDRMSSSPTHAVPHNMLGLFGHVLLQVEEALKAPASGTDGNRTPSPLHMPTSEEVMAVECRFALGKREWERLDLMCLRIRNLLDAKGSMAGMFEPVQAAGAAVGPAYPTRAIQPRPRQPPKATPKSAAVAVTTMASSGAQYTAHGSQLHMCLPLAKQRPAPLQRELLGSMTPVPMDSNEAEQVGDSGTSCARYPSRTRSKCTQHEGSTVTLAGAASAGAYADGRASSASVIREPRGFVRLAPVPVIPLTMLRELKAITRLPEMTKAKATKHDQRYTVVRTSVGGRNYTDEQLKQLNLIEAQVVAEATQADHCCFNLPRQGRTLTLTNIFKFIVLQGAGTMHKLACTMRTEDRTGRHCNFYDGKIDSRIVSLVKVDINDERITQSRKFSKVLLALIAEGCADSSCNWNCSSFTSVNVAKLQAQCEQAACAKAGNPQALSLALVPSALTSYASSGALAPVAGDNFIVGESRKIQRGKASDVDTPRMKKLKRCARGKTEATEIARSPSKEEDAVRAADILQMFKGGK